MSASTTRLVVSEPAPLVVAFESASITYSRHPVDLYNSGVNQILSAAAVREHDTYHFSMDSIGISEDKPGAYATRLVRPERRTLEVPYAYRDLHPAQRTFLPFDAVDLYFIRGDDVKPTTPGVELLRSLERCAIGLESLDGTLSTCDKYELVRRRGDLPQPHTEKADSLEEALEAIGRVPKEDGRFVLKDRFGYGCGKQVHLLSERNPSIERTIERHLANYTHVILQEFLPEVAEGDLVSTFFDGAHLGTMKRTPAPGEWKSNASLGAQEERYAPTDSLIRIAREAAMSFDVRLCSIDLFPSGKLIEINAFPGGEGLYRTHDKNLGLLVFDALEREALEARKRSVLV